MPKREARYVPGDHLMVCDRSGFTYRRSEMVREQKTGYWVHHSEVDPPHPQQYRRPVKPDNQAVSPVRPRSLTKFAPSVGEIPASIVLMGGALANGQLPDGTVSPLPEIQDGEIDDTVATQYSFLSTNEVDPTTF